jgi:hypothetical protein
VLYLSSNSSFHFCNLLTHEHTVDRSFFFRNVTLGFALQLMLSRARTMRHACNSRFTLLALQAVWLAFAVSAASWTRCGGDSYD